ncbi:ComEA family DNA-binding protein [Gorillibacterium sp. sgz500922]|uniref:ComEA family DNA-binding protein n=1 Tax=Gorillibacterium sp. sgz500922 TaxID=3446694 RepID=UPI003F661EF3
MWMMILQYRQRILVGLAALILAGGGFWAGRATAPEPELASGLYPMNGPLAAALPAQSAAPAAGGASSGTAAAGAVPSAQEPVGQAAAPERVVPAGQPSASAEPTRADDASAAAASGASTAPKASDAPARAASAAKPNAAAKDEPASAAARTGVIDLNTAGLEELMELPRIGEAKAKAIIAYREQHGGFRAAYEITEVKGIGQKTYEAFKDRITVGK